MVIPDDWLCEPESIEEVEERLAMADAPDLWLEEWRRFVAHFEPGDQLWSYSASSAEDPEFATWDLIRVEEGFAHVRDGEVVESISTACPWW